MCGFVKQILIEQYIYNRKSKRTNRRHLDSNELYIYYDIYIFYVVIMLRTSVELLQTPLSYICPRQVNTWYQFVQTAELLGRRTTRSQAYCGAMIP